MHPTEAHALARGYVWGLQDATAGCERDTAASLAFADAVAARQDMYNREAVCWMPNLESAYRAWIATGAKRIVPDRKAVISRAGQDVSRADVESILKGSAYWISYTDANKVIIKGEDIPEMATLDHVLAALQVRGIAGEEVPA